MTLTAALKFGINVNEEKYDKTALIQAASDRNPFKLAVVRKLLANNAMVAQEDSERDTALEHAITLGHAAIVEELLIHGAKVRITGKAKDFTFAYTYRSISDNYVPFELRLAILRMLIMWKGLKVLKNTTSKDGLYYFVHQLLSKQIKCKVRKKSPSLIDALYGNGKLLRKNYENPDPKHLDDKSINPIFNAAFTNVLQMLKSIDGWVDNVDLLNLGMDYGVNPDAHFGHPFLST